MKTVLTQLRETLLELSTTMEIITDHDKGYQQALINIAADIEAQQLGYEKQQIIDAYKSGGKSFAEFDYPSVVMDREANDYFTQTYKNEA